MGARWNQKNAYIPRALLLALFRTWSIAAKGEGEAERGKSGTSLRWLFYASPHAQSPVSQRDSIINANNNYAWYTQNSHEDAHSATDRMQLRREQQSLFRFCEFALPPEKSSGLRTGGDTSFAISCTLTNTRHPKSHHSLRFTPTTPLFKPPTPVRRPSYSLFDKAREVLVGHSFLFFFF